MSVFTGAGVALITPMHEDGSVNYDKLAEVIEYQIANHTDSIIICGTTGDITAFSAGTGTESGDPQARGSGPITLWQCICGDSQGMA